MHQKNCDIASSAASSPEHLLPNDRFKRSLLAVPHGPHGHPERTPSADAPCSPAISCFADRHVPAFRLSTVLDDHTRVTLISLELSSPSSHNRILSLYATESLRSVPPISGMQREADEVWTALQASIVAYHNTTVETSTSAGSVRKRCPEHPQSPQQDNLQQPELQNGASRAFTNTCHSSDMTVHIGPGSFPVAKSVRQRSAAGLLPFDFVVSVTGQPVWHRYLPMYPVLLVGETLLCPFLLLLCPFNSAR